MTLLLSAPVSAGSGNGKVKLLMAHVGDVVIFETEAHNDKPDCSTATGWAIDLSKETGKAMHSLLLTAGSQDRGVSVVGTNTCSAWADREAPRYIYVRY